MSDKVTVSSGGISMVGLLGVVLVVLKLLGKITISWWWCTAPFWGPVVLLIAVLLLLLPFIIWIGRD